MAPSLVPAIDLQTYAQPARGLKPEAISFIGTAFAIVQGGHAKDALDHLLSTAANFTTSFEIAEDTSIDDLVGLLDAGAANVFVSEKQLQQLKTIDNVDASRIGIVASGALSEKLPTQSVLLKISGRDVDSVNTFLAQHGHDASVYVQFPADVQLEDVISLVQGTKGAVIPIVPSESLTVDAKAEPSLFPAVDIILAGASSDRQDGLLTTLVTDERGIALGLVYSSKESVEESLRTGRGVYQSRKRGLWYKGESSGDVQELVRLSFDCDQDCLQFTVRQKGRGIFRASNDSS